MLPARLPFVLLNGASGIAVGLATEVPSHNLREVAAAAVALLRNDESSPTTRFELIPAPDFPGGGQIISSRRDPRRLRQRAAAAQGARALEDRGPGARPVAAGRHRAAAGDQRAARAGRDRGDHQPEGQGAGKKALSQSSCSSRRACAGGARTRCATSPTKDAAVRLVFEPKSRTVEQQDLDHHAAGADQPGAAPVNLTMIGPTASRRRRACARCWSSGSTSRQATVRGARSTA